MRKLRHRIVKCPVQGHTTKKWPSLDWKPTLQILEPECYKIQDKQKGLSDEFSPLPCLSPSYVFHSYKFWGYHHFPGGTRDRSLPANSGDTGSIPSGKIPYAVEQLSPWATTNKARRCYSLCSITREATTMRSPHIAKKSNPRWPQLEKSCLQQQRPSATNKYLFLILKNLVFIIFKTHPGGQREIIIKLLEEILGDPVVKTLGFHFRGHKFNTCHMPQGIAKEEKKKTAVKLALLTLLLNHGLFWITSLAIIFFRV